MTDQSSATRLSKVDVAKLMSDPSPAARADTTAKIAAQFGSEKLSPSERRIAEDIFRVLVKDAEIRVREALSAHLKTTAFLPHDIALSLAEDVDSVALPMLAFSEVLTDEDLISIVRGQSSTKQTAIARRPRVSDSVSNALVETGNDKAVARLVGNEGARLSEATLDRVIDQYENSSAVAISLVRRPNLPAAISERMVAALSERLQDYLVSKHDLSPDIASNLVLQARERAIMSLVEYGSSEVELDNLIDQLYRKDRLTPSLLLRALSTGDIAFFERAMSRMTGLPLQNVRILIHDKGMLGLEPLYLRANLPRPLFPAFRAAIQLSAETDYDGGDKDRERFVERMIERVLTRFEDPSERMGSADIEYLMSKLQEVAA